jgi:Lrp/AsnC family transcriptional regulator, leucine-responsive regulatory protein
MLDKKAIQIMKELDKNSRQSNTQIAKKVGLKKETVNYIIKKIEKQGMIKGYFSLINYFKLGYNVFKLLIRYQNVGERGEFRIVDWLKNKKEVIWIGKAEGKWNLIVSLREKELEKIYSFLEEFNKKFSKNIKEKQLLISYELEWLNEKYLSYDSKENYRTILRKRDGREKIDNIDEVIISMIENDARVPIISIAEKTNLTAQAVAKRIKNIVKKKIIAGFKLRAGLSELEKGYHHIYISLSDFSKIAEIIDYYEKSKDCVFIMKYHGVYDLHIEAVSSSLNDFRRIITEFRERFGNYISDFEHLTILEEAKLV